MKKACVLLGCLLLMLGLLGCKENRRTQPPTSAKINFRNTNHQMERIIFADGYLRTEPEMVKGNIIVPILKDSQGMVYGTRVINGKNWAKVTTRQGLTGWYTPSDDTALELDKRNYQESYPVVSGITEEAAAKINIEIQNYLDVFKKVVGPVGNNLQCRITYNQNNILSLVFLVPKIKNRFYEQTLLSDKGQWEKITKYAAVSPLQTLAASPYLGAKVTDLQYAMTFDLKTGERLTWERFLAASKKELAQTVQKIGGHATLAADNFYVEYKGVVIALAEINEEPYGRRKVDLGALGVKNF